MKTVLLAYERDQDLAALETLLLSRNHRVLKTRSGVEALEVARRESPQVVVSDVLLPKLDGFALCRRIKEDPVLRHLPVLLMSFRIEGAKYEAFAAEVGAERFFPRGSTIEELSAAIDELSQGSGTMRMPALVPELFEKREQDRRRVGELERQVKDLDGTRQRLEVAERVAREAAERLARERAEIASADAARIRELEFKLAELEARERKLAQAETEARGAAQQSQAELARVSLLETRLNELQTARARAQAAAVDAERAFAAQPVPTWLSDLETQRAACGQRLGGGAVRAGARVAARPLRPAAARRLRPRRRGDPAGRGDAGARRRCAPGAGAPPAVRVLRRTCLLVDHGARRHR